MNDSQVGEQKVAVITGVTSGIGSAIREKLLQEGWRVIGISRHLPQDVEGFESDLGFLNDVEPLCERILGAAPKIDAFIHVAGVWHDGHDTLAGKKIDAFTSSEIMMTMNVGVTSAMILCARLAHAIPDNGHVILLSGTFTDGGANWLPYYTSKRALEDFLVGLASDIPRIKVYGLSPADTATEPFKKFYPEAALAAQSPEAVALLCMDAISDRLAVSSGTVVEVRDGKAGMGYHT